jgi:DNA-binding NarL/FixJ family response regulator
MSVEDTHMPVHILIIDEDVSAAQVTGECLRRFLPNVTITIELTTHDGWIRLQQIAPDAVILDPGLHITPAMFFVSYLHQTYPHVRVIILASAPTPLLKKTMCDLNIDLYLKKPIPVTVLVAALR